ncbi:hypothetical protein PENTCL1PPCAC_18708, partial [Pristionchus entomophagus]
IMCVAQLICLLFEALKLSRLAVVYSLTRESCFRVIFIHIIAGTYQSIGIFIVGMDMLISLIAPIRYFNLANFPYLLYLQVPCVIFSALFPIYTLSIDKPDIPIGDLISARRKSAAMFADGVCTKYRLVGCLFRVKISLFCIPILSDKNQITKDQRSYSQLIPTLVCFSQAYYLHFAMSKEFRKAFLTSGVFSCFNLGRR